MPGTFSARMRELAEQIPKESVKAEVEVDQVYAHYQHEGLDFEHPRGGQAKYLEQPWIGSAEDFAKRWAEGLLKPDGIPAAARSIAEDGAKMVYEHAPVEFDNLRRSGHPTVEVDGAVTYDRPPIVPRLDAAALKVLSEAQDEGLGNHYRSDFS